MEQGTTGSHGRLLHQGLEERQEGAHDHILILQHGTQQTTQVQQKLLQNASLTQNCLQLIPLHLLLLHDTEKSITYFITQNCFDSLSIELPIS